MENFPKKKRGRPRKIPEPPMSAYGLDDEKGEQVREMFGWSSPTQRTRANQYYADGAEEVIKQILPTVKIPEDPVRAANIRLGMDWILKRKTVLAELGRMMVEDPTEQDMRKFQHTLDYVAERHNKLTAKAAVAYIRRQRLGGSSLRERRASLHHDLNAAINLHRKRHPESTWEDVQQAIDLTLRQVARKVSR